MQFAVIFQFDTTTATVIAHMEDDACTWKDDFEAFRRS